MSFSQIDQPRPGCSRIDQPRPGKAGLGQKSDGTNSSPGGVLHRSRGIQLFIARGYEHDETDCERRVRGFGAVAVDGRGADRRYAGRQYADRHAGKPHERAGGATGNHSGRMHRAWFRRNRPERDVHAEQCADGERRHRVYRCSRIDLSAFGSVWQRDRQHGHRHCRSRIRSHGRYGSGWLIAAGRQRPEHDDRRHRHRLGALGRLHRLLVVHGGGRREPEPRELRWPARRSAWAHRREHGRQ